MSRGLNKIQIIGRLGRDPEMRYTSQGTPVTNFSVATGGKWTDRNGNERDDTEWFRVEAWDRLGETCNEYLAKGREVYVEGRIKTRRYTDRDGNERTAVEVVANNILFIGDRGASLDDESGNDIDYADYQRSSPGGDRGAQRARPDARGRERSRDTGASTVVDDVDDIPF